MNELALFAGAGGGLLGSRLLGWRTVCYVENDAYCVEVIKTRIKDGMLDDAPIWDNVRTFDGIPWIGAVDIVTAGFPCQPWSVAGRQQGKRDDRNLWPDTIRIIRQVRPRFCLLENVPGLVSSGYMGQVLGDLAESGYDARWRVLSAAEVGAPHKRDRIWIVGYAQEFGRDEGEAKSTKSQVEAGRSSFVADAEGEREGRLSIRSGRSREAEIDATREGEVISDANRSIERRREQPKREEKRRDAEPTGDGKEGNASNTDSKRLEEPRDFADDIQPAKIDWWVAEPGMGRVVDGMAYRVDRLRAIGNGQVPGVVRAAWLLLMGEEPS